MNKIEFVPPKEFVLPEGTENEFDLVCTFKVKEGGKICLTKLGDTVMPGYDGKEEEHKPEYTATAKEMQGAMGEPQTERSY